VRVQTSSDERVLVVLSAVTKKERVKWQSKGVGGGRRKFAFDSVLVLCFVFWFYTGFLPPQAGACSFVTNLSSCFSLRDRPRHFIAAYYTDARARTCLTKKRSAPTTTWAAVLPKQMSVRVCKYDLLLLQPGHLLLRLWTVKCSSVSNKMSLTSMVAVHLTTQLGLYFSLYLFLTATPSVCYHTPQYGQLYICSLYLSNVSFFNIIILSAAIARRIL